MIFSSVILLLSASFITGGSTHSPNEKIIGGTNTTIEENPWQVAIFLENALFCGGSIIAPDVVITAAHCIYYNLSSYLIISGTNNLNNEHLIYSRVKDAVLHENYNESTHSNDVALLTLQEPLVYDERIKEIPLTETEPKAGDSVRATGWGVIDDHDYNDPVVLQAVEINVVGRDECQKDYNNCTFCPPIDETMICAGTPEGGKDHCYGDSGGPISKDGVLVGVISWANGCAEPGFPGVNTNIASIREWIREKVGV